MEPIAQVSQALQVIENVCKISSMVWVNKNQCKRIADRFRVIAEGLKGMELDKHPAGGSSNKDYPGFDELLTVLRKGEALVSYYTVWKGIISAVSRTDNREAFLEIHQELDTLDSQFHFEGLDGKYIQLALGTDRSALLTEDAEKDLKEMPRKLEELARINEDPMHTSQQKPDLDLETWQQVVSEKSKPVGEDGKLPIYLSIDLSTVETKAPVRELVRQSTQDPKDKDGWALVRNGSWLGCEFAVKVFKSGDQSEWNKEQLLKEVGALVELRHPHVIQLVGFGQDSERSVFLMEKMDADLRNFMKKKLEPAPRPKPRPFTRSGELDIITQIAKGMYYLHTQQYVHGDLKCTNILVKKSGDYLEVKIADLRNAMKLGGPWDQAAFEVACLTRRPRWTAPEAIKLFGGVRPSPDSLLKSDVYSFAMTCYEVVTGKYPFDGIKDNALLEQIEAGVRPELPGELDDGLRGVITSCWDTDPNNRPNFESICYVLDYIRSKQSVTGTSKSSGKDVVLSLFKRIPQVHGALTGLLGKVRARDQNPNSPTHESSSWDDQKKGHELQRSNSTVTFAEHLRIKPSDLKKQRLIGSGASARVYAATWLGCTFAVKRFKSQTADLGELTRELEFLISLRHPYVAQLVGLSVGAEQECMIVMEFMSSSLRELIECRQRKRALVSATQGTSAPQLADVLPYDLHEAVAIIWKIALGMAFLHSRGVMHRDLKSPNVLVNEHPGYMDIKIVDFGLSRYLSKSETHGAYIGVGTGFWRAPEILPSQTADKSSQPNLRAIDVYAFAMTSYEVLTGGVPCSELRRGDYEAVIGGYRPTLPSDLYPDLKVLIEKCWHGDPEQRPDFSYICEELRRIQQALSNSSS
jgi:serine/threonine protein kinase